MQRHSGYSSQKHYRSEWSENHPEHFRNGPLRKNGPPRKKAPQLCGAFSFALEQLPLQWLHPSRRPQERAPQDEVSGRWAETQTLMVRSASSRVSNHGYEGSGMMRADRKMLQG